MDRLIRVVVADDHAPTRAGVRISLEGRGFEVVGEGATADEAVRLVGEFNPDVALVDLNMPGNGVTAVAAINEHHPEVAIVVLTVSRDDDDLFSALRAGAAGYLLKDTNPDRLANALRGVLEGEAALPRTLVTRLVNEFHDRARRRIVVLGRGEQAKLTEREWEVLELLRQGLSTAAIADRIGVSQVTVRTYVAAILKKLKVPDRKAAIALVDGDNR